MNFLVVAGLFLLALDGVRCEYLTRSQVNFINSLMQQNIELDRKLNEEKEDEAEDEYDLNDNYFWDDEGEYEDDDDDQEETRTSSLFAQSNALFREMSLRDDSAIPTFRKGGHGGGHHSGGYHHSHSHIPTTHIRTRSGHRNVASNFEVDQDPLQLWREDNTVMDKRQDEFGEYSYNGGYWRPKNYGDSFSTRSTQYNYQNEETPNQLRTELYGSLGEMYNPRFLSDSVEGQQQDQSDETQQDSVENTNDAGGYFFDPFMYESMDGALGDGDYTNYWYNY